MNPNCSKVKNVKEKVAEVSWKVVEHNERQRDGR